MPTPVCPAVTLPMIAFGLAGSSLATRSASASAASASASLSLIPCSYSTCATVFGFHLRLHVGQMLASRLARKAQRGFGASVGRLA